MELADILGKVAVGKMWKWRPIIDKTSIFGGT